MMSRVLALLGATVILLQAAAVRAQPQQPPIGQPQDPVAEAPMRWGPFGAAPRIALTDFGVDSNVFNAAGDTESDFTATLSPSLDLWLRTARGVLTMNGQLDFVYFGAFASERSMNGRGALRYEYRFNRLIPFATFEAINTRQRPGFEIDARARRQGYAYSGGALWRFRGKTSVELRARRRDLRFSGDAVFDGTRLDEVLNHALDGVDLTGRYRLTPLTTVVVQGSAERDRFDIAHERNSNSVRGAAGVELSPFALIQGRAFIGYRRLTSAAGGTLPGFSGVTADVDVSYTAPTDTQIALEATRDVEYSIQIETPYYVQTGWYLTLTQRLVGKWDGQVMGGRYRLAYETQGPDAFAEDPAFTGRRVDRITRVGAGFGYRLNPTTRVGFTVESYQRQAGIVSREYRGVRSGVSISHAF